jgi:hypothetical protein
MEAGMYEVTWYPCASPRRSDVAGADLLCERPRGHAGNHAVGSGVEAYEWPAAAPSTLLADEGLAVVTRGEGSHGS